MENRSITILVALAVAYLTGPALISNWHSYWDSYWNPPDAVLDPMSGPWITPAGNCQSPDLTIGALDRPTGSGKPQGFQLPRARRERSSIPTKVDRSIVPEKFYINFGGSLEFKIKDENQIIFNGIRFSGSRGPGLFLVTPEFLDAALPPEGHFLRAGLIFSRCSD